MSDRSAIILVIDGLGATHIGPYGNSWVGTPGLDALAAESLVIEYALADAPQLVSSYRSFWQGRHAMCGDRDEAPLAALCRSQDITAHLITDAPDIANHHLADEFDSQLVPINLQAKMAATPEQTHSARFAEAVVTALDQLQPPFCLWVHAMGLSGPWDCPYEMRINFVDEEADPDPPEGTVPPQFQDQDADPDLLWGHHVAHAAQVSLIDASLSLLLEAIRTVSIDYELLTLLTSPRGYPLGERGIVGYAPALLHAEQLHVPLLVRGAPAYEVPLRGQTIAQHPDVFGTLAEWLELGVDRRRTGAFSLLSALDDDRHWQSAAAISGNRCSFRTAAWYLETEAGLAGQRTSHLFVKPDDRLEVNEVASRLPETVQRMHAALLEFEKAAQADKLDQLVALDAELRGTFV